MIEIMRMLLDDHRNMAKLLEVLDRQILQLAQAGTADYNLIKDILDYTLHYPTRIHHPLEDLVYQKLKIRDANWAETLNNVEEEHAKLETLTRQFAMTISRCLQGEKCSREQVVQIGQDLVNLSQRHMNIEEAMLFPAAQGNFTPSDWADIALALAAPDDPLFGPRLQQSYQRLREEIQRCENDRA
jgi:hemerythrin-like domain-containing protein